MTTGNVTTTDNTGFLKSVWPDVNTDKGMRDALKAGALAIAYLAVAYAIYSVRLGAAIAMTDAETFSLLQEQYEVSLTLLFALYAAGIAPAAALAWLVWKRHSIVAMWAGVIWLVVELASKLLAGGSGRMMIAGGIALLCSLHGLRAVHASKGGASGTHAPAEA